MKNHAPPLLRLVALLFLFLYGTLAQAQDFSAVNADGDTIYYNFISGTTDVVVVGNGDGSYSDTINIPSTVTHNATTYTVTTIGNIAFRNCSTLTAVTIPNTVTTFEQDAFIYCTGLTTVDIPNSVITIGRGAFYQCTGLTDVTIGSSVTLIDRDAFKYCSGLTSIVIPNSVITIGRGAFHYCSGLTEVHLGDSVITIGYDAFSGCSGLDSIIIPNSVQTIGPYAFYNCTGLTSVTIGDSVTLIDMHAFRNCSNLRTVEFGESLITIGTSAFDRCTSLQSVILPNSVTTVGNNAFWGCWSNGTLVLGDSLTTIGNGSFYNHSAVMTIIIPNSVESIGVNAFKDCFSLRILVIGENVDTIMESAFEDSRSLDTVYSLSPIPPTLGPNVFKDCRAEKILVVPCGSEEAYRNSAWGQWFPNIIVSPPEQMEIFDTICQGSDYVANDFNLTNVQQSGVHIDTLRSFTGCDSVITTLNLTVNPTYQHTDTVTICDNALPYSYGDSTFLAAGQYAVTFSSMNGCDSVMNLALLVNNTYQHTDTVTICDNALPYSYGDSTFAAAGQYTVTFFSMNGCDSIVNLALLVNNTYQHADTVTICDNALPYNYGDSTFAAAGQYAVTFSSMNGCDSVMNLALIVNPTYQHTDTATICDNALPYSYGDSTFAAAGQYAVTFSSINGCDSIVNLALIVNPTYQHTDTVTICSNALPYSYGDSTFSAAGQYTVTFSSINGCDSVMNLALLVNNTYQHADTVTICDNALPYNYGDSTFVAAGQYAVTFSSMNGCDSIVNLALLVNNTYQHADTVTICDNALPYSYGDSTFVAAGQYAVTFSSMNGCDSIVNLALIVNPTYQHTDTVTICDNALPYSYGDSTLAAAGQYAVTFSSMNGCDSIVNLALIVNTAYQHAYTATVCDNALPYSYGDSTFSAAGQYTVTFSSINGCDSIVNLALIVNPTYQHTDTVTICDNALPYSYGDSTFVAAGQYAVTFSSTNGCDSVVNLALLVNNTYQHTDTVTICSNALPYSYGDSTFSAAGQYTVTFSSINGCDSVMNLALLVNNTYQHADTVTICDNALPYNYGDSTFLAAGQYAVTFSSMNGCDSIVNLALIVNPTYQHTDTVTICSNALPYSYGDSTFSAAGQYTVTFSSINGCDSVMNLALLVNNTYQYADTVTVCDNALPYSYGDSTFSTAGQYTVAFLSRSSCDSIVTLTLTVNPTLDTNISAVVCQGSDYTDNGFHITNVQEDGTHTLNLQTISGCDSTVNLQLNLVDQSLLARIDVSPDYATLTRTEITFRDISLNGTRRIWLMPDGSRRYDAVVHYTFPLDYDSITTRLIAIDSWGCQDSAEVTIPLRKECIWIPNAFTPGLATNNRFMVKGTGILSFHIEIYDRNGSLVARWDGLDGSWDGTDLHGHPCPNGSYMYLAKYSHVVSPRAVQHKRGTITLLR